MPTLSQFKILSRFIVRKTRLPSETEQYVDGYEETHGAPDPTYEQSPSTNHDKAYFSSDGQHASGVESYTVRGQSHLTQVNRPGSSGASRSLTPRQGSSGALYSLTPRQGSSGALYSLTPRPGSSGASHSSPRPKSGKTVSIQEIVPEIDTDPKVLCLGSKIGRSDPVRRPLSTGSIEYRQARGIIVVQEGSTTNSRRSPRFQTQENGDEDACPPVKETNNATASETPSRPILRRADSCFVRRPDSHRKSVTFRRPFSSTRLYSTDWEGSIRDDKDDVDDESGDEFCTNPTPVTNVTLVNRKDPPGDVNFQTETPSRHTPPLDDRGDTSGIKPNRPSSCGPTFRRAVQVVDTLTTLTRPSQSQERRLSIPGNNDNYQIKAENSRSNLPRPGAFLVRRDSILSRNMAVMRTQYGRQPGQSQTPAGSSRAVSPGVKLMSPLDQGGVSKTQLSPQSSGAKSKWKKLDFEAYVIRDCHLIKRVLKSPNSCTLQEEIHIRGSHLTRRMSDIALALARSSESSRSGHQGGRRTAPPPQTRDLSSAPYEASQQPQYSPLHGQDLQHQPLQQQQQQQQHQQQQHQKVPEQPVPAEASSATVSPRSTTPTTMVAIAMRAMRAGSARGERQIEAGPMHDNRGSHTQEAVPNLSSNSIVDGLGSTGRWSNVRQAIISSGEMEDIRRDSNAHNNYSVTVEDFNATEQEELQKLGFRKRGKGKKKKKKKKNGTETSRAGFASDNSKMIINLKEDPVLLKMSKKNQNIGKFTGPPEPKPNAVCFEIQGSDLTHNDVKFQLEKLIRNTPEVKLVEIQFHHRSVIHNTREMLNRWIITANSVAGRNRLAGASLNFGGFQVQLRRYDDIVNTEYQQFTRMTDFAKMMTSRLGAGTKT